MDFTRSHHNGMSNTNYAMGQGSTAGNPTTANSIGGNRRGLLNYEAKALLKAWMFHPDHIKHPYPTDQQKQELAVEAGIDVKQLTNWFTNARKRLWQPFMVEHGVNIKAYLSTGRGGPRVDTDAMELSGHGLNQSDSPPLVSSHLSVEEVNAGADVNGNHSNNGINNANDDRDSSTNEPTKRKWSCSIHDLHPERAGKKSKTALNPHKDHHNGNPARSHGPSGLLVASGPTSPPRDPHPIAGIDQTHPSSSSKHELNCVTLTQQQASSGLAERELLAATALIELHCQHLVC